VLKFYNCDITLARVLMHGTQLSKFLSYLVMAAQGKVKRRRS